MSQRKLNDLPRKLIPYQAEIIPGDTGTESDCLLSTGAYQKPLTILPWLRVYT